MKIYLNKILTNIKEIFVSFGYFFRQIGQFLTSGRSATLGGNLDPFFLIAPLELFERIKNKKISVKFIGIFLPIIIYCIFQICVLKEIMVSRLVINIVKVCLCILIMMYVKEHANKIDIYKTAKITSVIIAIFTTIACILKNSDILWRFNDIVNKYTTTRLQLFYLEPSELGFHVAILIIVLISHYNTLQSKKEKIINLLFIITNIITLYLARPFGAIIILVGSICIMTIVNLIKNFKIEKLILYILIAIVCLMTVVLMYLNEAPIIMRVIDTINGTDSSNGYRIDLSIEVMNKSLKDYKYIGCGFGNLNSHNFRVKYGYLGIAEVLANSYIYYIIEGGIFSIITLAILICYLIKHTFKQYSVLKLGLLVFLIAYQIFGGHFTSGLTWALYGLIASNFNENSNINKKEEVNE